MLKNRQNIKLSQILSIKLKKWVQDYRYLAINNDFIDASYTLSRNNDRENLETYAYKQTTTSSKKLKIKLKDRQNITSLQILKIDT